MVKYQNSQPCPSCGGSRLRREARHVRVGGETLHTINQWPLKQTAGFFQLAGVQRAKAGSGGKNRQGNQRPRAVSGERRPGLPQPGPLGRLTLSGGEAQHVRLASQIGSGLTGVMYVLDEPSIGLHQRDNDRLLATLMRLRDLGNSVIVVEHDEDAIRAADYVVDMGPGAGEHGGEVLVAGTPAEVAAHEDSVTGAFCLLPANRHAGPAPRADPARWLTLSSARGNNLKNVTPATAAGLVGVHHRGVRLGQIHADQRHAIPTPSPATCTAAAPTGAV
ncbi:MAG: hypothetical protein U1E47_01910 [Rivihabitans pingtungensis]